MPLIFWAALFVGSGLLFCVQPLVAKLMLPILGGSATVWTACVLFFQTALVAGYLAAHLAARLPRRAQVALFAGALAAPLAAAAFSGQAVVSLPTGWTPPMDRSPIAWLLACLAVTVGAPFLALSAGSLLLQRWYSYGESRGAGDPYFLYVASNAGSLLALVAYPVLVEPALSLAAQRSAWTIGYAGFLLVVIACGALAVRGPESSPVTARPSSGAPSWATRARWTLLALVPSSLMLGVTQFVSTDIAAFPLLWVIPLAVYLLTYIVAFSSGGPWATRLAARALPVAAAVVIALLVLAQHQPIRLQIGVHLLGLLIAGVACHGLLALSRPEASRLTEFYLLLSVGGALGGVFNAVIAPWLFAGVAEYPLAVLAATLLAGWPAAGHGWWRNHRPRGWELLVPVAVVVAYELLSGSSGWFGTGSAMLRTSILGDPVEIEWATVAKVALPVLACLTMMGRPLGFALGLGALAAVAPGALPREGRQIHAERSFYGVHRVLAGAEEHSLWHGSTIHGQQFRDDVRSREPTTYYTRTGPIGEVMAEMASRPGERTMAFVGLGSGTLAAYGRPGWHFDFYEIDPAVVRVARDPALFSYLSASRSAIDIVLGDARLGLSRAPDGRYDLIALDAFSSDAIPVHLLTREAIEMYLAKLKPGGLLVFHVTNRYLRLTPVLASIAHGLGVAIALRSDFELGAASRREVKYGSDWVVMARHRDELGALASDPRWHAPQAPEGFRQWTDDYSNIMSVLALW